MDDVRERDGFFGILRIKSVVAAYRGDQLLRQIPVAGQFRAQFVVGYFQQLALDLDRRSPCFDGQPGVQIVAALRVEIRQHQIADVVQHTGQKDQIVRRAFGGGYGAHHRQHGERDA